MNRLLHYALTFIVAASWGKPSLQADPSPVVVPIGTLNVSHDGPQRAHISCEDLALEDDWGLNLQRDSSKSIVILTSLGKGETGGIRMAMARGFGYKYYLVAEKGIDADRVLVYANATSEGLTHGFLIAKNANYDSLVQGYAPMAASFAPGPRLISFCPAVSNAKTSTPFSSPSK